MSCPSAASASAGSGHGTTPVPSAAARTRLEHPQVGPLELSYEKLPIPDTDRQTLAVYHAEPGSASAQKLALLASMAEPIVVSGRR